MRCSGADRSSSRRHSTHAGLAASETRCTSLYSLQTRCLSHPIVLSRLSRPCELNDRFRLCRPRRYLLCAHQFAADSVRVDGGRLAHPKARARPVVKDSFQTVFGMFIRPHREKSGIGKKITPEFFDRLPRARILTHLTRFSYNTYLCRTANRGQAAAPCPRTGAKPPQLLRAAST